MSERALTLVLDFDGTISERDVLDAVLERFGDPDVYREVEDALEEGRLTLHEVIRREFDSVRVPLEEVVAWALANVHFRAGFRELVADARRRRWRVVVVSSGFRELIEPLFARERIEDVEVLANNVDADPRGWRVRFRDEESCETCGQPCKRAALVALAAGRAVYVGDGYSDRCAAAAADRVFARDGLARYLRERGVAFEPFDDFYALAASL